MTDFAQARTNMVDCQIHTSGVVNSDILNVFEELPREIFLPQERSALAYCDEDIVIGGRLYMMEPMVHARLLEEAGIKKDDVVLDIGCASGYSTAVLSTLASTVLAVEEDEGLLNAAESVWNSVGANNVVPIKGSLAEGNPDNAPYDVIFINGAVGEIPLNIVSQLRPQGRLFCIVKPLGEKIGKATMVQHLGEDRISAHVLFDAATPYLTGFEPKPGFKF